MFSVMKLVEYSDPNSLGSRLRRRRRGLIEALIDQTYSSRGSVRILDLGGQLRYWEIFDEAYLRSRRVHVTLLNRDPLRLGTSGEDAFDAVTGDACDLSGYGDNAFDLVHSNSTIEHVGDWKRVEAFAREARRLASRYYIQTPYYWFPVEPHFLIPFFHWLPEGLRAKMFVRMGRSPDLGRAMQTVHGSRLLDRAQMAHLFPDARIQFEWIGPIPKSVIAVRGSRD
jgi:Methyltransferase domain